MRLLKCSVFIASLDGYIARLDGNIDWLTRAAEKGEDCGYQEFYASTDCLVIGRKTHETVLTFGQGPYGAKKVVVLTTNATAISDRLPPNVQVTSSAPSHVVDELRAMAAIMPTLMEGKPCRPS